MEIWDLYTREGEPIGRTHVRGEKLPEGMYHIVCETMVRHRDGSYLLMKRAMCKPSFAGYLEVGAGGAAQAGETPIKCIRRELREETGIDANGFTEIAYNVQELGGCLVFSYFCLVDVDKSSVTLQEGETEGYVWMTEDEFIEFVNSDSMIPTQKKRFHDYLVSLGYVDESE